MFLGDGGVSAQSALTSVVQVHPQGAPRLRLLLLNSKGGNLWSDGTWTYSMIERLQAAGVCVIHSAGYKTNLPVIEEYLREALVHSPELRKHAKNVL